MFKLMRGAVPFGLALSSMACVRGLRAENPDSWLELQSEHFTLRTDLAEATARKDLADLELIRNALLAARWRSADSLRARIGVVAVAGKRELHEILADTVAGITAVDRFGDRTILVDGLGNLLESSTVKHEVTHALLHEMLVTNPRWV